MTSLLPKELIKSKEVSTIIVELRTCVVFNRTHFGGRASDFVMLASRLPLFAKYSTRDIKFITVSGFGPTSTLVAPRDQTRSPLE